MRLFTPNPRLVKAVFEFGEMVCLGILVGTTNKGIPQPNVYTPKSYLGMWK